MDEFIDFLLNFASGINKVFFIHFSFIIHIVYIESDLMSILRHIHISHPLTAAVLVMS